MKKFGYEMENEFITYDHFYQVTCNAREMIANIYYSNNKKGNTVIGGKGKKIFTKVSYLNIFN